jgi:tRNA A-37 threonylcarbamoyl transferase component Bud32
MITITKKLNTNEYEFLEKLEYTNIIPTIYDLSHKSLTDERYETTLEDYIVDNNITKLEQLGIIPTLIYKLIDRIHKLGIVHGDLHTNNIVINTKNNDVRLIDFSESKWVSDMDEACIINYNVLFEPEVPFKTLEDLMKYELVNWINDYFEIAVMRLYTGQIE